MKTRGGRMPVGRGELTIETLGMAPVPCPSRHSIR